MILPVVYNDWIIQNQYDHNLSVNLILIERLYFHKTWTYLFAWLTTFYEKDNLKEINLVKIVFIA